MTQFFYGYKEVRALLHCLVLLLRTDLLALTKIYRVSSTLASFTCLLDALLLLDFIQ